MKNWWMLAALGVAVASCESSKEWSVSSPDGAVVVEVELTPAGEITYAVAFNGEEVIADSKLGFDFANADDFLDGFELYSKEVKSINEAYRNAVGANNGVGGGAQRIGLKFHST